MSSVVKSLQRRKHLASPLRTHPDVHTSVAPAPPANCPGLSPSNLAMFTAYTDQSGALTTRSLHNWPSPSSDHLNDPHSLPRRNLSPQQNSSATRTKRAFHLARRFQHRPQRRFLQTQVLLPCHAVDLPDALQRFECLPIEKPDVPVSWGKRGRGHIPAANIRRSFPRRPGPTECDRLPLAIYSSITQSASPFSCCSQQLFRSGSVRRSLAFALFSPHSSGLTFNAPAVAQVGNVIRSDITLH
ncbi:hypothetical protein DFP72DRAFT_501001 [Ephemerocybe angulata]|uniref:Uncharacterized protein n=1 Tax=Ephemerocybe angulata TaxID=980116 RepID=A0A8H6HQA7_9AGAR|nr:hypothetical protein DFP72DRAFT_501001 [Tulosesus angulatus]